MALDYKGNLHFANWAQDQIKKEASNVTLLELLGIIMFVSLN